MVVHVHEHSVTMIYQNRRNVALPVMFLYPEQKKL